MLDRPHPNAPKSRQEPKKAPLQLIPWDKIRLSTAPRYLIKNLIPKTGLVVVYGPPKCGKTFWLFDVLMHIALGWDYRGRRTHQGGVVYCLFEGQDGFAARKEAFEQRFLSEYTDEIPFVLMPTKIELVKDHPRLIEAILNHNNGMIPAVVTLDTLNRSFTGSESSDEAMTAYVAACDAIREALNCVVVIVHHSGLAEGRSRGHTSLLGAADAQIAVRRDAADNVETEVEYMKDGPDGHKTASRLEAIEVEVDEDGDGITSCVVVATDPVPETQFRLVKRSRRDKTFDEAFEEIVFKGTVDYRSHGDGPLVHAVQLDTVELEFKRRYVCDKGDTKQQTMTRKKQWQAAVNDALTKRGYAAEVTRDARQLVWRTEGE